MDYYIDKARQRVNLIFGIYIGRISWIGGNKLPEQWMLNKLRIKLLLWNALVFIRKLMIFGIKEKKEFDAFSVSGFREPLGGNADGKQLDR